MAHLIRSSLKPVLVALGLLLSLAGRAGGPFQPVGQVAFADTVEISVEDERLVSSSLALLLGPFAAHRIYLGTTPKVAIIYGLTFGGFGVLALIDLGHLLFSKDLEAYRNNDKVIMWGKPQERLTPQ